MFKLSIKLILATLLLTGLSLGIANGRAAAANCPDADPVTGRSNWGVNVGESAGAMAGATIHATVGTYTNDGATPSGDRPSNYGNNVNNINYTLNASNSAEGNNRIFTYPAGEQGRKDALNASTGNSMYIINDTPIREQQCDGWSVMGPGAQVRDANGNLRDQWGNGWVLDCGIQPQRGDFVPSHFWLSFASNPSGQEGYWEVKVAGTAIDTNINNMSTNNNYFTVTNGATTHINLIWHQKHTKTFTGGNGFEGTCEQLAVWNWGSGNPNRRRVYAEITGISLGRLRVFDKDGNLNQNISYPSWPGDPGRPRSVNAWVGGSPGENGVGPGENGQKKVWNYIPWDSNSIHIKVEVQDYWDNDGNGSKTWNTVNVPGVSYNDTIQCYSAKCSIQSVTGDGPGGIVTAGGTMHIHATLTNTSRDMLQLYNPPLSDGGGNLYGSDDVLDPGDTHNYYIDNKAPPTAGYYDYAHGFVFYPVYFGRAGNDCSGSVPIYEHFVLEPHATLNYKTAENPGPIGYNTYIQNNSSAPVTAPTTSNFTSTPFGGGTRCSNVGPVNSNGPYNPGGPNYVIGPSTCSPPSFNAGDQFCTEINLTSFNQGYVGPGGDVKGQSLNGSATDKHCVTVVNEPYFKAYAGGISAGGDFSTNGNCSGGGLLAGWNDNTGGQARGASSQLSALALIKITGVASAQAAAPTSSPPGTGLTFANTANGLTNTRNADSPTLGGNYDSTGGSHCLNDVSPPTNGGDTTSYNSSQTIAAGGTMSVSGNKSIFVNGDVYIAHNITYSGSWAVGSGPSFVLRATGNIYIATGVTELNGVYIAKHKIYTCGVNNGNNNFAPVNSGSLYGSCNTQLVVYGSFVAQQVNLMRTYGSLRNSTAGEQPTGGSISCSYSGGPGNKSSCAGEIFILSPGMYLTNPAINLPNNGAVQYDSITSLPPVL